jgi:L-alanine-DL-glutamate epimerase-like enolase superfamily enzyme
MIATERRKEIGVCCEPPPHSAGRERLRETRLCYAETNDGGQGWGRVVEGGEIAQTQSMRQ